MSNIIDSIRMSGTTYAISDSGGTKVVEITQSDYDNLPTSAKTANIMYVITDAEPFDVSNYYTKAETSGATELATAFAATQPKLSAGTNITIDANNVISAEGGGGGKAVSGGTNISVTTGETADTISCTIPAYRSGSSNGISLNYDSNTASGSRSLAGGSNCKATSENAVALGYNSEAKNDNAFAMGQYAIASGFCSAAICREAQAKNMAEFACGQHNVSNKASTTFGDSGNTLFSVGNGTSDSAKRNAFEIRQNGDIYITSGNTDIKLQDHLGGGGGGIDSGTVQTMIDQSISGKTNQTDFVSHSGNTSIHVTTAQTAAWDAKSDFSGSYNDLTDKPTIPIVPTNVSSFNNDAGYITSNDISGKTNQSDFVSHSGNTTMHVTASEKSTWNNKSDFSGNYNDLSNKPTIPTSASQLTNDSGYITSSALNGYATEDYVTAATNDMATKTWVGQQGYLTQHQDISGKQDVSGMTAYTTTATTNTLSGTVTAHTADTTIHVTAQDKTNWNNKSDFSGSYNDLTNKLSAGTNITIVDNVISAEGGGKAIVAGTGIAITTGETANTVSLDINAKKGSTNTALVFNYTNSNTATAAGATSFGYMCKATNQYTFANGNNTQAKGYYSHSEGETTIANGWASHSDGQYTNANGKASHTEGSYVNAENDYESSQGRYNVSNKANTTWGNSGNTLFSVGNGTANNARHNAFEIRQNGDIYISLNGQDVKLQDQLGGGGSSYSAGTGIDITNDVISVSGVVMSSAITTNITSSSTDVQVPSAKAVNDKLGGLSLVKLTQSAYDALSPNYDSNTLYVIVN